MQYVVSNRTSFAYTQWFREFWLYRELFLFLVWRDIKIRYKQTALGALWAIIQPFFTMIIFTLFFGKIAKLPSDGMPYPIFYYSALIPWTYFSVSLGLSGNSLVGNANLIRRVYFPRVALPTASALGGMVDFAIASVVLLGMMLYYDVPFTLGLLLWPVFLVPTALVVVGLGMILSALNVKYRDIKYAIPFFIQSLLFITPVIYPTSMVPERLRFLLYFNPLTGLIDAFRAAVLPTREINWTGVGISVVVALILLFLATLFFRKTEREFADII
jgi:lipopolysaccharide transport system permease protein